MDWTDATKQKAGWVAISLTLISGAEGLRQIAYRDPIGIPTACFGETKNIKMGDKFTLEQCRSMLASSLEEANQSVSQCVKVALPDTRRAALLSFTYNVGGKAFCASTLVKKLNAGDTANACQELNRWVYAHGIKLPGLVNRRQIEYGWCMQGLT